MTFSASYKIIPEYRLIIEYFEGPLSLKSFLNYKKDLISDEDYVNTYNSLYDLRKCSFDFNKEELMKYIEFARIHEHGDTLRHSVLITSKPDQVVLSSMYAQNSHLANDKSFVVSTVEKAVDNLLLPQSMIQEVTMELERLKLQTKSY